jgi:D-alanine transaminase
MARIAYVNGRYLPLQSAAVAAEDRGYQFADGVYEVIKVLGGEPRDLERHLDRLARSHAALEIAPPMTRRALESVLRETLRRNQLSNALLYVQVTRGSAPRNHLFPRRARPSLVVTVRRPAFPGEREREEGVGVITRPDLRWGRCDIKSISLLPNVLARQSAAAAGCREAWLVDGEGSVTEGSASNAYIVDAGGRLITHPLGGAGTGAPGWHRGGRAAVFRGAGACRARGRAVQHQFLAAAGHHDRWSPGQQRDARSCRAAADGAVRGSPGRRLTS